MEYQVPRYLDAEPKIFGPLTFKNILTVLIVGAALAVLYFILRPLQFALLGLPIGGLTLAMMFLKMNGRPFIAYVESLFKFTANAQVFLWRREGEAQEGVGHLFHIVSGLEAKETDLPGADPVEAPQGLNVAQRQKIAEIAQQLDGSASVAPVRLTPSPPARR